MNETTPKPKAELKSHALDEVLIELKRLNRHSYLVNNDNIFRMVFYQILRGLAFGLGSVLGATFLVSVLVYFLSNINFIPILGEWGAQIADQILQGRSPR